MQSIAILFVALIGIGVFARKFDTRTRLLVLLAAASVVIYVTLK